MLALAAVITRHHQVTLYIAIIYNLDLVGTHEFQLYKKTSCVTPTPYDTFQNNSFLYSCAYCGSHCPIVVWCVAMNQAYTVEWVLPQSSSYGTVELCLCTSNANGITGSCQSSSMEGVYTCTITQAVMDVVNTLQFIYNVIEICTPLSLTLTASPTAPSASPTAASCLMEDCSTVCSLMQETPLSYLNMSSILSVSTSSSLLSSILSLSISSSLSSSISSSCPSTVTEQVSTTPHYAGIGLLVATNLITIILLISSCVYIFSQRKKSKL